MSRQDDYQEAYDNYKANTKEEERFFCSEELFDMSELFDMWVIKSALSQITHPYNLTWWQGKSLWYICEVCRQSQEGYNNDQATAQQEARDIDG
tara:strand:- start:9 stop:290 length:282 start_codon:yes stop_codon:yes gene_type:complete